MENRADAPSSISVDDWIKLAGELPSKNTYIESAVELALELTKALRRVLMVTEGEARLEELVNAENVLIFLGNPALMPGSNQGIHTPPLIKDVKFNVQSSGVTWLLCELAHQRINANTDANNLTPSCPRSICVALGKVLLKIFSRGRSSSFDSTSDIGNNDASGHADNVKGTENNQHADIIPPAGKRMATSRTNHAPSGIAKSILLDEGMPLSICRIVCDLLDAGNEPSSIAALSSLEDLFSAPIEECPNYPLSSIEEVVWELTQMKKQPQCFLYDRTCPQKALEDACLFANTEKHLIGREKEIEALMKAKDRVSSHANGINSHETGESNFICEATFLCGHAGSGKSCILHSLIHECNKEKWFALECNFDKKTAPHIVLAKAFDVFFSKWELNKLNVDPEMKKSFLGVCGRIFASIDDETFRKLHELMPSFSKAFPLLTSLSKGKDQGAISSLDKVGSAKKRIKSLFRVLFDALFTAGIPLLVCLDDMHHWSSSKDFDIIDLVLSCMDVNDNMDQPKCRKGLLIVGSFRINEGRGNNHLMKSINSIKQSDKAEVTLLTVGHLSVDDVSKLISAKFCLPRRYTQELAGLVHKKTARGNPFHVIQLLRSLVSNKMLHFCLKYRRWVWDCDIVDTQMIDEGVAKLLTKSLDRFPATLMQTMRIVSCLGSQVDKETIDILSSGQQLVPFNMSQELERAVKVALMEKAGPVYMFSHEIIHSTVYELIDPPARTILHKTIGYKLLGHAENSPAMHLLAVDQINMFCENETPSPDECPRYAECNLAAAKFAVAASSFDQARLYINAGMRLLGDNSWKSRYPLTLELHEMSANVCFMQGDITSMTTCLDEIFSHAKNNGVDTLPARFLMVKLLTSSSRFEEAKNKCLAILEDLGEVFPPQPSLPHVLNDLSTIQVDLKNITHQQFAMLPRMNDQKKLNAMKAMSMLLSCSVRSKPMLLPIVSCRMVKITLSRGFCDESIVGLSTAGYGIFLFTEKINLGHRIGKVCQSLIEENPKRHVLRSRLCSELVATIIVHMEPIHTVVQCYPGLYNSAMMAGDIESAMICRWTYSAVRFSLGVEITSLSKELVVCLKEAIKFQQNTVVHSTMAYLNCCACLAGHCYDSVDVMSYDEIDDIAERANNVFVTWQTFMCRMNDFLWMRDFVSLVELSEKHSDKHPSSQQKRILELYRTFYVGIASLSLARDTKQGKWRRLGENAMAKISQYYEYMVKPNIENKFYLVKAELHYLDEDLQLAQTAYEASINSAHKNNYLSEEALALELYGHFCIETCFVDKGCMLLGTALEKYQKWGATKKVAELQLFIDLVKKTNNPWHANGRLPQLNAVGKDNRVELASN